MCRKPGGEFAAANPDFFATALAAGKPDDLALFSYTSGTTSRPKGVMLSHANLLERRPKGFAAAEDIRAEDEHLSYLPMAWIGNSVFSLALHLLGRVHLQLSGAAGDRDARPARARADPGAWRRRAIGRTR